MMTCHDDLIQLYVEGELTPAERAIVAEHLRSCPACRRQATIYKGLFWDLTHDLPPEPSLINDEALAATLRAEWQRHQPEANPKTLDLSTLWLTANPAVTGPAKLVGQAGRSGLQQLAGLLRRGRRGGR